MAEQYAIPSVLCVVGPTASGKTDLSLRIAQQLLQHNQPAEIICADSRTLYKGLSIATAKPSPAEQSLVPHWGVDLLEPNQHFSAASFKEYAVAKIADIQSRGKLPIVVGGTGLYIDSLLYDFDFGPAHDPVQRQQLESKSIDELQNIIRQQGYEMPENFKNKRYLVRAIEQKGINRSKRDVRPDYLVIGLRPDRQELKDRIRRRAHAIVQAGAVQEAERLFAEYGLDAPAAAAPFYKACAPYYMDGVCTLSDSDREQLEGKFATNDWHLAKRQLAWFKRSSSIHWFVHADEAYRFVCEHLFVSQ